MLGIMFQALQLILVVLKSFQNIFCYSLLVFRVNRLNMDHYIVC
jgi:hypothetical protein